MYVGLSLSLVYMRSPYITHVIKFGYFCLMNLCSDYVLEQQKKPRRVEKTFLPSPRELLGCGHFFLKEN